MMTVPHLSPKNIDYYVDIRLIEWSKWSLKMLSGHLGYPNHSAFLSLRTGSHESSTILSNEPCEETDKAINELGIYKPPLSNAVRIRYLCSDPRKEIKKFSMSYDQYKKSLQLAKCWLAGALLGKYRGEDI